MEEAAGGGQDCGKERSVGIRDGGETEVAEGAAEQTEVFVLFFLCLNNLEHGSGGGGGEDSEGRPAGKVVEEGGEREVEEYWEDRGTRLSINRVSDSFVGFIGCSTARLSSSKMEPLHCSSLGLLCCSAVGMSLSGCCAVEVALIQV